MRLCALCWLSGRTSQKQKVGAEREEGKRRLEAGNREGKCPFFGACCLFFQRKDEAEEFFIFFTKSSRERRSNHKYCLHTTDSTSWMYYIILVCTTNISQSSSAHHPLTCASRAWTQRLLDLSHKPSIWGWLQAASIFTWKTILSMVAFLKLIYFLQNSQ